MTDTNVINDHASQMAIANQLSPDLMLLKMENESIFAIARTRPRNNVETIKQLLGLIEVYPDAADDAIYSKPVGTVTRIKCGNPKCGREYEVSWVNDDTCCDKCDERKKLWQRKVKKFAEGLSIRAAENIRSVYGFTRLETRIERLGQDDLKITGIFVDYAAGNVTMDSRVVSPWYKKSRTNEMVRTPDDRFLNVIVKAEKSKLRRDIILDSVPSVVKMAYRDACEKKLQSLITPEYIQEKIVPNFESRGVTLENLEKIIGRPMKAGWTNVDLMQLKKLWKALEDEETTVAELLSDLDDHGSPDAGAGADLAKKLDEAKKRKAAKAKTLEETKPPAGETKEPAGETNAAKTSPESTNAADSHGSAPGEGEGSQVDPTRENASQAGPAQDDGSQETFEECPEQKLDQALFVDKIAALCGIGMADAAGHLRLGFPKPTWSQAPRAIQTAWWKRFSAGELANLKPQKRAS